MDSITAEKKAEVAVEPVKADGGAELTEEKLGEAWRKLSELYAAKPRLAAAISSGKVEIDASEGKQIVRFFVKNLAQKQWIEEKLLHELEGNLCKVAGVHGLKLSVEVPQEEDSGEKTIYMPEEQAEDLMKKNQNVRDLVKDFELNI